MVRIDRSCAADPPAGMESTGFPLQNQSSFGEIPGDACDENLSLAVGCAAFLLAACDVGGGANSNPSDEFIAELPEGVLAIVGPYQDLRAVKIDPVDGCYVYRHFGPVETTFLPLRAANGRPICTRAPDEAVPTA